MSLAGDRVVIGAVKLVFSYWAFFIRLYYTGNKVGLFHKLDEYA